MNRQFYMHVQIKAMLATLTVVILLYGGATPARTIVLVSDEWPPFNTTPGEEHEGYMVDVAREIFESLGHKVEYKTMPWSRALKGVLAGAHDGVIGATRFEADGLILPEESLGIDQLALYVRDDSAWTFEGLSSLDSVRLGVIKGYSYLPYISGYIAANQNNPERIHMNSGTNPLERLLGMLMLGRIDAVLDTEASIRNVAAELGFLESMRPAGRLDGAEYLFIAFSPARKDSPDLAEALATGIRRLRATGRLALILRQYNIEDWTTLSTSGFGANQESRNQ